MSSSTTAPASLPISTLYIKNLNTKVNKSELRKSLYSYFSAYGQVLDVVALKTQALRGQAWIVYGDHASAKAALRDAGGKSFFGKPMVRVCFFHVW
ncbi:hypothetical protein BCR44DRAFT_36195 [Catenaria anguillulae PL171]|uniref:RRM domain-containing protein n=1 Tax=Catenaria anguillulae PL171 TaxID=765915 RepID=A0A1Y2HIY8_9FUNG|nr:hypothetical protein BCR44DRAFT_36195 [Catenaria anguillulae PL171]